MRPAQKAPENAGRRGSRVDQPDRFNEAGAKSAGKPIRQRSCRPASECFNEAGAKSAGKPAAREDRRAEGYELQ